MEPFLAEYLVNSIWQVPLLAAAAWVAVRILHPAPRTQHRVWAGLLPLMLLLPLSTLRTLTNAPTAPTLPSFPEPQQTTIENTKSPCVAHSNSLPELESSGQAFSPADPAPSPIASMPQRKSVAPERWIPMHEITLSALASQWLVALYLAAIFFMALRLLFSWSAARRLVVHSKPTQLSEPASELLDRCCALLDVRKPRVLISSDISGPMLVGVMQPALLLPEAFRNLIENSCIDAGRDLEAVWLHELAHLRRRDYLANLFCRVVALPLDYHPATHAVQRRIRRTREMVCDEVAAVAMQSRLQYARCLVGLAHSIHADSAMQAYGIGMFEGGILEERIMQLTQTQPATSMWTRTIRLAGAAIMTLSILAAPAIFHVTPMLAQEAAPVPATTAAGAPASGPTAAVPQSSETQPAPAADPAPGVAYAAQKAETKQKAAYAKTAKADSKVADSSKQLENSRSQLEDAHKRLDEATQAWTDAAQNSGAGTDAARQQIEAARRQLDEATAAWNEAVANTVDSTIREQQTKIGIAKVNAQLAEAQGRFNSPEFQKQMADLQAKFNSPEFKEKMNNLAKERADAQVKLNSPEFKKQMADLQARFNSPEFKKQMADVQAKINSPEFKEKIDNLTKQMADAQANLNNPEFKERMQELSRQMASLNGDRFKSLLDYQMPRGQQSALDSQLDEVRREIDDALRIWSEFENVPAK